MYDYELIKLKENTLSIPSSLIATHLNVNCEIGGSPQSEGDWQLSCELICI